MMKRVGICLLISLSLVGFVGCSGGGSPSQSNVTQIEPQIVVQNMIAQWSSSNTGPAFYTDAAGKPSVIADASNESQHLGYITFRDLSGEDWELQVDRVEYAGEENAKVYTSYIYQSLTSGGLTVVFSLVKDNGQWFIDDIEVIELPAVVTSTAGAIQGYITDQVTHVGVAGARIDAFPENSQSIAGSAVSSSNGFYEITDLATGTYYIVINRDGYEPITKSGIVVY